MAVPKSGGCCGASRKPAPKKSAPKSSTKSSATKKSTTKSTSSKTTGTSSSRNSDEALKKRLKKVLGKDNDTKGNSDLKETKFPNNSMHLNEIQKFILNAAKTEKKATPFSKIDKNVKKTTTTAKTNGSTVKKPSNSSTKAATKKPTKSAATKKSTSSASAKKTTTTSKKTATAVKKTTTAKKPASASASTNTKSAPAVRKTTTTAAKKTSSTTSNKKTPATTKKKTTASSTAANKKRSTTAPKRSVPAKKPKATTTKRTTNNRMSCGGGGCGSRKMDCRGCGCGCGDDSSSSSSYDSSDDESETESETESTTDYTSDDSSYTSDETDTDSSTGGGCGGGACGRPQQSGKNGPSKGGDKDQDDDSSGSWETEESDDDKTNYSKKACNGWQCVSVSSPIDTSNACNDSNWASEEVTASSNYSSTEEERKIPNGSKPSKKDKTKLKRPYQNESTDSENNLSAILNGYEDISDSSSENDVPIKKKIKIPETQYKERKNLKDDQNIAKKTEKKTKSTAEDAIKNAKTDKKPKESTIEKSSSSNDSDATEIFENGLNQSLVPYNLTEITTSDYSFDEYENASTMLADFDKGDSQSSSDFTYEEGESSDDDLFVSDSDADDWYDEEMSEEGSEYSDYENAGLNDDEEETGSSSFESFENSESEYESSRDDDYQLPEGVEEDILIKQGEAKMYDATDDIQFDSDDSSPQIFELPREEINLTQSQKVDSTIKQTTVKANDDNASDKSSDSCPQLVPIDYEKLYNFGEDDSQCSLTDDSYSSDSCEGTNKEPPIYEPEVINAGKCEIVDISFVDNILQTSLQDDSETNFPDPLTCIMQKSSNAVKKTSVSSIKMRMNSKKKEPVVTPSAIEPAKITSSSQPPPSKFYNSLSKRQLLLLLKAPIYLHGALKVKLLAGNLNILGYDFTVGETQEIFSPRGNNLLSLLPGVVETSNKTNKSKADIAKKLSGFSKDFMQTDIEQIAKEFDPKCNAIVLLERNNHSKRINMVQKYMKEEIFPNTIIDRGNGYYKSELFTHCRFFTECLNSFNVNPEWNSINLIDSSKLIVVGGKGVGKSTFIRYTINKNLRKFKQFLLIDLDIGQPETFTPMTISATIISKPLIGPGHYYGLKPVKSYLYGDINVVLSPLTYLTNVKELSKYCHGEKRFKSMPWVVNTMGYNKGFGAELLSVIIEYLQPTDVVQLVSEKQYNNFDYSMSPETVRNIPRNIYKDEERSDIFDYNLYEYKSVVPSQKAERSNEWTMTAKESRLTMIIAMLGDLMSERDVWLTDVSPYSVAIDDVNLICIAGDVLSKADLLDVVNANLVYLCKDSKPAIECYGIGIVRGVDKFRQILYLLPSVPPQTLAQVNTIAVCNMPLPASILLNQGPKIKGMVPYTYNTNDLISSKHVPQHLYRPQHFLQGARNTILDE